MNTSEKLLSLRKQHGYSQEELAEKLNVSRQAISRWEANQALPDTLNIIQITKLYGISADYLLNDEYSSEDELPIVRHTEERVSKSSMMQMSYILSLAINVIALFIGAVGFFISKNVAIVLFSIVLSIMSIAGFEASLVKYVDDGKNDYRRKFYDISVWIVSFIPVSCIVSIVYPFILSHKSIFSLEVAPAFSVIASPIAFMAVYLPVCLIARMIIRSKCK